MTTRHALQPTAGARYLLVLRQAEASQSAVYDATVYSPSSIATIALRLHASGEVEIVTTTHEVAAAHLASLLMFAKLTARGVPAREAEQLDTWPQRVLRWRADKSE